MANLSLSIQPGYYLEPQTAEWVVGPGVEYVSYSQDGIPPAISEYIAYDNLNPPTPFLAVMQDGLGRVVYDGGFPKFYNGSAPAAGAQFADLSASHKFLYNALTWIANPDKVAAGNRNILVLGDANSGASYSVKDSTANSFRTTFDRLFASAGFIPTYKTRSDYAGGFLDARLAELDSYCAVVVMSSTSTVTPQITTQSVTDIGTFRTRGGGIMLITDHGQNVTTITQANNLTENSFFATANKIMSQFGAYFTGNLNRSPVNVGYIRENYGDHPLYNGMLDSESIYAATSESKVVVAEFEQHVPGSIPPVIIDQPGTNVVQGLGLLENGEIETYSAVFVIAEGQLVSIVDNNGAEMNQIQIGIDRRLPDLKINLSVAGLGSILGTITRNQTPIGSFSYTDAAGPSVTWFSGSSEQVLVNDGDVISATITTPFTYGFSATVSRFQPDLEKRMESAAFCRRIGSFNNSSPFTAILDTIDLIGQSSAGNLYLPKISMVDNVGSLVQYFSRTPDVSNLPPLTLAVYATDAQALAGLETFTPPTQAQIFEQWGRVDQVTFYPPGSQFPTQTAAWFLDEATGQVVQPLNTNQLTGFVSKDASDNYVVDVVLNSSNNDDDFIGLILAAPVINYGAIGACRPMMAFFNLSPLQLGGNSFAITTIPEGGAGMVSNLTNSFAPANTVNNGPGWTNRTRRMRATRQGDDFRVQSSDWNSSVLDPAGTIEFNVNDVPGLERFSGAQHYGLASLSQADSRYSNLTMFDGAVRDTALVSQNGNVYQYALGTWAPISGVNLAQVYGVGRLIISSVDGKRYRVQAGGQLLQIT